MRKIKVVLKNQNKEHDFRIRMKANSTDVLVKKNKLYVPNERKEVDIDFFLDEITWGPIWFKWFSKIFVAMTYQYDDTPIIINKGYVTFNAKITLNENKSIILYIPQNLEDKYKFENVIDFKVEKIKVLDNPNKNEIKKWQYILGLIFLGLVAAMIVFLYIHLDV